jgi:hypothetical protein
MRTKRLTAMDAPSCVKSNTDKENTEPMRANPKMANELPTLMYCLRDIELPKHK